MDNIANSIALIFQLAIFISVPLFINLSVTLITLVVFLIFALVILKFANPLSHKYGKMNVETANVMLGKFIDILKS